MSTYYFVAGLAGFLSGIICRSFLLIDIPLLALFLLLFAVTACVYMRVQRQLYLAICIFLIAASIGVGRVMLVPSMPPPDLEAQIGTNIVFSGTIVVDPDIREASQRVIIEGADGSRVLAVAPRYPELHYGTDVQVEGMLARPEPFMTDGGRTFRYDQFLAKDRIFLLIEEAHIEEIGPRNAFVEHVFGLLIDLKHLFMDALEMALPEPHGSLAAGMLLGGKQGLGNELIDAFTLAGLVHIVVLSGYNIMIIAEAVFRVVGFLPRRVALWIASGAIISFVLVAGAGAAALRAGIMALIGLCARATGKTYDVLRALSAAVVLMLIINPLLLAFDPGFQLSVLATLGLIVGAPIAAERLSFVKPEFLREIVATTIAAQIFVLPLLLYQTGSLSFVSLPANLLVLPAVPLAMFLSFVAGVVALTAAPLASIAGVPAYIALSYILTVTDIVAGLPFAQFVVPAFPFAFVFGMYVLLAMLITRIQKKRQPSRGWHFLP